ncbi:HlyD family efflux transporter periplasmic adaptor subunit [Paracoccus sp. PAMC 22219]|uniref:HlyD family efflux transporter periplasmic adaptor subunit n=1 Tax=Paracoccus sp. PAMC 22219 TaxID=1569209 RepID=UPI000AB262AB|nr:HlyD family secretion protein [Paracoccus sp. PAMC 22219]
MEVRLEEAARAQIATLLAETSAIRDDLDRRADIFRTNRLEELRTRLTHARSRLAILEQEQATVPDPRLLDAVEENDQRLPAEPRLDALVLDHARERVAILQIALGAAQQGVFLGDGYNDAPNAEQRSVELRSEIATLNTRLAEADARLTAVGERADRERLRVNSQIGGDLQSPVTGIFWDVLQADGVNVQRGDPLLRLVDCNSTVVTLSVTERTYNDLAVGQPARFRLAGSSEVHDATVARLAGSGAAAIYQAMAVAPSQQHLERFDVALIVPALRDGGGGQLCHRPDGPCLL